MASSKRHKTAIKPSVQPSQFPFRSLPSEIQLNIFRQLIGERECESSKDAKLRKKARAGMLRLDKDANSTFGPEFYSQAVIAFEQSEDLVNKFLGHASDLCLQNLTTLSWTLKEDSEDVRRGEIAAGVDVIFSLPKLASMQTLEVRVDGIDWELEVGDDSMCEYDEDDWIDHFRDLSTCKNRSVFGELMYGVPPACTNEILKYEMEYKKRGTWHKISEGDNPPQGVQMINILCVGISMSRA